jgi:uncharacterized membrane protein
MNWFKKHLNITFFLGWLLFQILFIWGYEIAVADRSSGYLSAVIEVLILYIAGIGVLLVTEIWFLRQKKRALWFLFLNLIPEFGTYSLLLLRNKAIRGNPNANNAEHRKLVN